VAQPQYAARDMTHDVDLFVIGGGSGGVRAARVAAEHGARVAIAEEDRWGGTCVVRGCVPKKLMVYASEVQRSIDDARGQGWTIPTATFDWATFMAAKDNEIERLSSAYAGRLEKAGVRVIHGRAELLGDHKVRVIPRGQMAVGAHAAGETISAANILIAVGGRPRVPPEGEWMTSDEVFRLERLPARIGIFGAGYIGVEFAHIFAGFGAKVTLIRRSQVLRGFDEDLRAEVEAGLVARGVTLQAEVGEFGTPAPDTMSMSAIGRDAQTTGLGLDLAGVKMNGEGQIPVDEWSRSNVDHIYAVGDVTGRVQLTPVAIREGHAVSDTLFGNRPTPIRHHLIPTAVFAQPPAASIGFTEHAARGAGHDIVVFRARFKPMRYSLSGRDERVMIKLIVDRKDDKVLGLHMVGPDAPEIVQAAAIAVTMGATKADFDRTFALHPTTAEELVLLR
jgi:glutathione reductase (NADPH)